MSLCPSPTRGEEGEISAMQFYAEKMSKRKEKTRDDSESRKVQNFKMYGTYEKIVIT